MISLFIGFLCLFQVDQASNTSIHNNINCTKYNNYQHCEGRINFNPIIHRWWFLVLSFCDDIRPLDVKYKFTITDGSSWERQISAEESGMVVMTNINLIIFTMTVIVGIVYGCQLAKSRFLHIPYKLFLVGLAYEFFALVFDIAYYFDYLEAGLQLTAVQILGSLLQASSEIHFVILLILLAEGFTITRGRLPKWTTIKLACFTALYGIIYVIYYVIETKSQESAGLLRNSLDGGAEVGLIGLRMVAWAWLLYAIIQTIRKYPEKQDFYCCLSVFFTIWLLTKPLVTVFARFLVQDWQVAKVTKMVNLANCTMGYVVFLHLTRPTSADRYFPFHVRTNQIDVVTTSDSADFPHTEQYSKVKANVSRGRLEVSLTDLERVVETAEEEKFGTVSIWFPGNH